MELHTNSVEFPRLTSQPPTGYARRHIQVYLFRDIYSIKLKIQYIVIIIF